MLLSPHRRENFLKKLDVNVTATWIYLQRHIGEENQGKVSIFIHFEVFSEGGGHNILHFLVSTAPFHSSCHSCTKNGGG